MPYRLSPKELLMPEVPWNAVWVNGPYTPGHGIETIQAPLNALMTPGLYLYCSSAGIMFRVPWGEHSHNGLCVVARSFPHAEYLLAEVVVPELAAAYDHLQLRQPSLN